MYTAYEAQLTNENWGKKILKINFKNLKHLYLKQHFRTFSLFPDFSEKQDKL